MSKIKTFYSIRAIKAHDLMEAESKCKNGEFDNSRFFNDFIVKETPALNSELGLLWRDKLLNEIPF